SAGIEAKAAANWIISNLFGLMNKASVDREAITDIPVTPEKLAGLIKLVNDGTINQNTGVKVLEMMFESGQDAQAIVDEKGLAQVSDTSVIAEAVAQVIKDNEGLVQRYLEGQDKLFGALMGKAMGALKGKGNPQVVREQLTEQLNALRNGS
ncbi:MAG: Asp-tRNA(Asn)/Glu-tRNA(Gln) amidotransferase GatCAB subunit B, partial [Chloroflexi bacterium]